MSKYQKVPSHMYYPMNKRSNDDMTTTEKARALIYAAEVADYAGDHGTAKFFRRQVSILDLLETE